MFKNQKIEISIPSFPNTGRMVDYWLGGSHHFPVYIEAAKLFEEAYSNLRTFFEQVKRSLIGELCQLLRYAVARN